MQLVGRTFQAGYRYQFNGMEQDEEVSGQGNSYTTMYRGYDPRLARWKSLDPLMSSFPSISGFSAYDNNPIYYVDPHGLAPGPGDPFADPLNPSGTDPLNSVYLTGAHMIGTAYAALANLTNKGLSIFGASWEGGRSADDGKYGYQRAGLVWAPFSDKNPEPQGFNRYLDTFSDCLDVCAVYPAGSGTGLNGPVTMVKSGTVFSEASNALKRLSKLKVKPSLKGKHQNGRKLLYEVKDGTISLDDGWYDYVITTSGELRFGDGHYILSDQADEVLGAGQIFLEKGKIALANNNSGHYIPTGEDVAKIGDYFEEANLTTSDFLKVDVTK